MGRLFVHTCLLYSGDRGIGLPGQRTVESQIGIARRPCSVLAHVDSKHELDLCNCNIEMWGKSKRYLKIIG